MNHKLIFAVLLILVSIRSRESKAADFDSLCSNYEKVSGIVIPYMQNFWPAVVTTPSGPVPTTTAFVLTARSPIVDFCSYLNQMKNLTTTGQIFKAGEIANEMTGSQHTEKIGFARDTYDMGENVNNINKPGRKLDSDISFHRRVNSYLKTADRFFNGDNAHTFENKGERESKMRSIIRSSNRIALIKEASDCATPQLSMEEEVSKRYEKEIIPLYPLLDEENEEISYFLSQLQNIGIKLSRDYGENEEYQKMLYDLVNNGVVTNRSQPKIKYHSVNKDAPPVAKNYYTYSFKSNQKPFRDFRKKYEETWNDFTYSLMKTRGLVKGRTYQAEKEFRDLGFECRRSKIEWVIRKQNPRFSGAPSEDGEFSLEVDKKVESCHEGIEVDEEKLNNLLASYTELLWKSINNKTKIQVQIWNFESEFQGINRNVSETMTNTDIGDLNVKSITCDKKLSYGESVKLTNDLQAVTIEHRASMAELMLKKTIRKEEEERKRIEQEEKIKRDRKIYEETERRRININDDMIKPNLDEISF